MSIGSSSGTRSSLNWNSTPGSFDVTNAFMLFESDHPMGLPNLKLDPLLVNPPKFLGAYREKFDSWEGGAIHFFSDDYRFETVWRCPRKGLAAVQRVGMALAPDFSMWTDWPVVMQMWNLYRSRWCARYWQENGVLVIPTMKWSDEASYSWCFRGIEKGQMVAVGAIGRGKKGEEARLYNAGYAEMVRRVEPSVVLCYGKIPDELKPLAPFIEYPTRYDRKRKEFNEKGRLKKLASGVDKQLEQGDQA